MLSALLNLVYGPFWAEQHAYYTFTVGGITHICFKKWFQITADTHSGVSKDHSAKFEKNKKKQ